LSILRESLQKKPISDIELFYWPKDGSLEGEYFTLSMENLRKAVEVSAICHPTQELYCFREQNHKPLAPGFHVAELYERFPCFDSYDYDFDKRLFRNYFISREPFTDEMIRNLQELKWDTNSCKVNEQTPSSALPAVYYEDGRDFMLVGLPRPK